MTAVKAVEKAADRFAGLSLEDQVGRALELLLMDGGRPGMRINKTWDREDDYFHGGGDGVEFQGIEVGKFTLSRAFQTFSGPSRDGSLIYCLTVNCIFNERNYPGLIGGYWNIRAIESDDSIMSGNFRVGVADKFFPAVTIDGLHRYTIDGLHRYQDTNTPVNILYVDESKLFQVVSSKFSTTGIKFTGSIISQVIYDLKECIVPVIRYCGNGWININGRTFAVGRDRQGRDQAERIARAFQVAYPQGLHSGGVKRDGWAGNGNGRAKKEL